jgi:NAD(P)-dependent dehydrogenase (short-subunit alcohol dehydrogenase family)
VSANFQHALIVGGSGMLGGVCRALLKCSEKVSVLARNEARIRALSPDIAPVVCDYNDGVAVRAALATLAAPDLLVAWIHGRAPQLRRMVAAHVKSGGRFVQVLGSASADPAQPQRLDEMRRAADGLDIHYQAVVLGFKIERSRSRWLSDGEISNGVWAAIETGAPLSLVGKVEPWGARP